MCRDGNHLLLTGPTTQEGGTRVLVGDNGLVKSNARYLLLVCSVGKCFVG